MSDEVERLIWRQDLMHEFRVCPETVRRWIKTGKLPQPDVSVTDRTKAWKVSTLRAANINFW